MTTPSLAWERLPPRIKALAWYKDSARHSDPVHIHFCVSMVRYYADQHVAQKSVLNNPTGMSTIPFANDFSYISLYGTSAVLSQTTPTGENMTFQIETGVPVPKRAAGRTGSKYPFGQLEVGQSFLVPAQEDETEAQVAKKVVTLRSAIGAFGKRNPGHGKFAVRPVAEGVRVWRTE